MDCKLIGIRDVSIGRVVRKAIDIEIAAGRIEDEVLLEKAKTAIKLVTEKTNAIVVFFWSPGQQVGHEAAKAAVDWAPFGKWHEAYLVKTGDYSKHEFKLSFNKTG